MPRVATNSPNAGNAEQDFRESALQHLDGLYGHAMTLAGNQAEAEDLVQETYLRALQAFERLRPDSNLKSWLFTILRNIRLNQVRDGVSTPPVMAMGEPADYPRQFEDKSTKDPLFLYKQMYRKPSNNYRRSIADAHGLVAPLGNCGEVGVAG